MIEGRRARYKATDGQLPGLNKWVRRMASALVFIQWENYVGGAGHPAFFDNDPISFHCRQERLHRLTTGDRLWLVSRNPDDGQYYFVAVLTIAALRRNPPDSETGQAFGEFAVECDRGKSLDLRERFQAEGLLRAFVFETGRPIKYGANIGHSLQTLRVLSEDDERVLNVALAQCQSHTQSLGSAVRGLWTKCDKSFADYFLGNWASRREPLAFLLYDPPPAVRQGLPVFIHSDKGLRLVARFVAREHVAGYKLTVEAVERTTARERIWSRYRANTFQPPSKQDFDTFWESQHGIRALFVMDEVVALPKVVAFKEYGRALEWGYPMGVGYRYLNFAQSVLLLRVANLPRKSHDLFLRGILSEGE